MDDICSKVEILGTVNSGVRGNENSAPKGSLIKMDATTDAIFKLQNKVDRLTERLRHQGNGAEDPKNDKEFQVQMGELRGKISSMERALVSHQRYVVTESRLTLCAEHAVSDAKHHGRNCNGSQAKTGDYVLPANQGV
jgi:hypothetical protein